jgi:hypothetical protein
MKAFLKTSIIGGALFLLPVTLVRRGSEVHLDSAPGKGGDKTPYHVATQGT